MKTKLLRHKWWEIQGTTPQQYECGKCLCKKGYSHAFGQLIYYDRFGKLHFRAPECVLPNTKL